MPPRKRKAVDLAPAAVDVPDEDLTWLSIADIAARAGVSAQLVRNYGAAGHARTRQGIGPRGARLEVALEDVVARRAVTGGTDVPAPSEPVAVGQVGAGLVRMADVEGIIAGFRQDLSEAGNKINEQTERAVRAETEASFLRERLAELREQETSRSVSAAMPPAEPLPRRRLFGRRER